MAALKLLVLFLCALTVQGELADLNSPLPENARSEIDGKVFLGNWAKEDLLPHQVHLFSESLLKSVLCGGSLISTKHVLTAAQCIYQMTTVTVRMGSTNSSDGIVMISSNFITHALYNNNNKRNDIGIVYLPSEIQTSCRMKPIRLPRKSQAMWTYEDESVIISGWGVTIGGIVLPSLMWARLVIIQNDRCYKSHGPIIDETTICGVEPEVADQFYCYGKQGGALIIREDDDVFTQIGVSILNSCVSYAPNVFLRTGNYLEWIEEHTGIPIRLP